MARYFDANLANYLDCGDASSAQITGTDITAMVWVRMLTTAGTNNLFCKWGQAAPINTHEWLITTNAGQFSVWTMTSGGANYTNAQGGDILQFSWQHVVLRQDASALAIFVDGKQAAINTPARSINNTANRTLIGRHETADPANAILAQAAVWGAALTNAEIVRLARGANPRTVRQGGLRGCWALDEATSERDWSNGYSLTASMQGTVGHRPDDSPREIPTAPITGLIPFTPPFVGGVLLSGTRGN